MRSFVIWFIIIRILNSAISFGRNRLIPGNAYLAEIRTSIVLAFVYSVINYFPERSARFKDKRFYTSFMVTGIIFLLLDLILFCL